MKKCFVVSPIGDDGSDVRKRADQLFKHIIEPVCKECEFEAVRVDKINKADTITSTIIDHLKTAELVIADISGHNPNVFYEMGCRMATGKPIIHLREKGESLPFDIAGIRAIDYDLKDLDVVSEVKERLCKTIVSFDIKESDGEEHTSGSNENVNIIPLLFSIQDQLVQMKDEIHANNKEMIETIIKAAQSQAPVEDSTTAMIKILLPELIKNPDSMKSLVEISEMAKNAK